MWNKIKTFLLGYDLRELECQIEFKRRKFSPYHNYSILSEQFEKEMKLSCEQYVRDMFNLLKL